MNNETYGDKKYPVNPNLYPTLNPFLDEKKG